MIENARQRAVTADRISKFKAALETTESNPAPDVDPIIAKAYMQGLESVLATLQSELDAYDASNPVRL